MTSTTAAGFRLDGATVAYNGKPALQSVDLTIQPGEAVAFVGPSGAGKTTLLRLLNGSLRPSSGRLHVDGKDLAQLSNRELRGLRSRIGFVHQHLDLVPNLIGEASASSVPCVYHSHATCQMSSAWRESFDEMLDRVGRDRDLAHISLEWLKDDPGPRLHLTTWSGGRSRTRYLADCHHHGRWMRWHGEENECSSAD